MTRAELRLAVLGDPVDHSLSPAIHTTALRECGIAGSYERIHVTVPELAATVDRLRVEGFAGFNVTIPHKEAVIPSLDRIDGRAKQVGAVNTVVREGAGSFGGHNTDLSGLSRLVSRLDWSEGADGVDNSVHRKGPLSTDQDAPALPQARPAALVLGSGGAARACVVALKALRWRVTVANRTVSRARATFGRYATVIDLSDTDTLRGAVESALLIVNATSVGLNQPGLSPIPRSIVLPRHTTVMDLVYAPLETRLLRDACRAGCRVINGLELLAAQAADSFQLWTGERLPDAFFRSAAESALISKHPVKLVETKEVSVSGAER